MKRVVGVLAVAGLIVGIGASVTSAGGITDYHLKTPHENKTFDTGDWAAFPEGEGECAGVDLDPGEVLWHFVLSGGQFGQSTPATAAMTSLDAFGQTGIPTSFINPPGNTVQFDTITGLDANTGTNTVAHSDGSPGVTEGNNASLKVSHTCFDAGPTPPTQPTPETPTFEPAPAIVSTPVFTG